MQIICTVSLNPEPVKDGSGSQHAWLAPSRRPVCAGNLFQAGSK